MTSFGVHGKDYKGASVRNRRVDNNILDVYAMWTDFHQTLLILKRKYYLNSSELYVLSNYYSILYPNFIMRSFEL